MRWADAIYPYMKNTEVYMSPQLDEPDRQRMNKPFNHTCDQTTNPGTIPGKTIYFGGYGYNWQYLGNGRTTTTEPVAFFAKHGAQVRMESLTVAVADTDGSRNGGTSLTSEGIYVIDPPLPSRDFGSTRQPQDRPGRLIRTSATPAAASGRLTASSKATRRIASTPAERNNRKVNVLFCDGHGEAMKLKELDDFDKDGKPDNGYWNGKGNAAVR